MSYHQLNVHALTSLPLEYRSVRDIGQFCGVANTQFIDDSQLIDFSWSSVWLSPRYFPSSLAFCPLSLTATPILVIFASDGLTCPSSAVYRFDHNLIEFIGDLRSIERYDWSVNLG